MAKNSFYLTPSGKTLKVYTPDGWKGFRLSTLERNLQNASVKSLELTKKYGHNAQFTEELGANELAPIFLRRAVDIINDVQEGILGTPTGYAYTAEDLNEAATLIKTLGGQSNKEEFEKAFFGAVADYYGTPDLSVEQIKKGLEKGNFKIPVQDLNDVNDNPDATYSEMKAWIIDNIADVHAASIRNINSSAQLREIMQTYKLYPETYRQRLPRSIFQYRHRKNPTGRRERTKLGIKPRKGKKS